VNEVNGNTIWFVKKPQCYDKGQKVPSATVIASTNRGEKDGTSKVDVSAAAVWVQTRSALKADCGGKSIFV